MVEIRTTSGVRLDVNPTVTIEVNMGGISLLSLADRTATYTNSFSLPRTPTNESVFAFASQPTRNNRPVIDVIITKGLFQRQAVLKAIEFENNYKCSVSYDDYAINALKEFNFFELPELNKKVYTKTGFFNPTEITTELCRKKNDGTIFNALSNGWRAETISSITTTSVILRLQTLLGLTFEGSILSDSDFLNLAFLINSYQLSIGYDSGTNTSFVYQNLIYGADKYKKVSVSDILKLLSHLFLFDIKYINNIVKFTKLSEIISDSGISIEGFNFSKKISGYYNFKYGYIKYDILDKTLDSFELLSSDKITGIGESDIDLIKLNSIVPRYYSGTYAGYDLEDNELLGKISSYSLINGTRGVDFDGTRYSVNSQLTAPLALSGFYSNILNPIFSNPVILEATRYIDSLTADNIMNTRIINSVQLGGRYWVDQMAYNLSTGQSKLTLIKLP
jgi:hypothetical protein